MRGFSRTRSSRLAPADAAREMWPAIALSATLIAIACVVSGFASIGIQRTFVNAVIVLLVVLGTSMFSGTSGVLSFGHVAFMAVGAYTSALLSIPTALKASLFPDLPGMLSWLHDVSVGFLPATLLAGLVACVLAAIAAVPISRLDGVQAAIATLALLVISYTVLVNWEEVTRGDSSVIGVAPDTTIVNVTVWGVIALLAVGAFRVSRRGMRLRASADDVPAVRALGVRIGRERIVAFAASAFLAGVAGSLFAHYNTTFAPRAFYLDLTFLTVAMLVIGGLRTLTGAMTGVVAITLITELMQRTEDRGLGPVNSLPPGTTQLVLAGILLAILILRPSGIFGEREWPLPRRLRPAVAEPTPSQEGP
jgi:branched-chain amino acid transport system permease protein